MRIELLLFSIGFVSAGFLQEEGAEEIDPIKQSDDNSEHNDQSKRTLFYNGDRYALEKHVKYHPYGYKYLLGYRPVKLQFVPMARPLFTRPRAKPVMQLRPIHIGNKPVISLVPPKLNPIYKSGGYVYGKPLPANVPPTIPTKPWQHQGWNMFEVESDKRPFIPSNPLPDADNNGQDHNLFPQNPPTVFPVIPTTGVQSRPTFEVQPVQPILPHVPLHSLVHVHPSIPVQHVVPIPASFPTVNLQPTLPLPPPIQPAIPFPLQHTIPVQPTVPLQPIPVHPPVQPFPVHPPVQSFPVHPHVQSFPVHPPAQPFPVHPPAQPNFNTVLHHTHYSPLHFLHGKLNIPVPDLGVLPLGSSVPVQLSAQNLHGIHKPSIIPVHSSGPIHYNSLQTHAIQRTPVFPINMPDVHLTSQEFHRGPVVEPPIIQKFVPEVHNQEIPRPQIYLGEPQHPNNVPDSMSVGSGFTPVENPLHHDIHISGNSQDQSMLNNVHQIPSPQHNYQYFVQHFPHNNAQQYQQSEEESQGQMQQQQGYEESPGFFQPGQTDLQIPDYLPEHPHFKQLQQYQDNSYNVKKR